MSKNILKKTLNIFLILVVIQVSMGSIEVDEDKLGPCWGLEVDNKFIESIKIEAVDSDERALSNFDIVKYTVNLAENIPKGTKIEIQTLTNSGDIIYSSKEFVEKKGQESITFSLDLMNKIPFIGCARNILFINGEKEFEFSGPEVTTNFLIDKAKRDCINDKWTIVIPTVSKKTIHARLLINYKETNRQEKPDISDVYSFEINRGDQYDLTWQLNIPCAKKIGYIPYIVKE